MPLVCPACQAENADHALACFECRQVLSTFIGRGTLVGKRFQVLEALGGGGMGLVYRAHDLVLKETVALKVLRADRTQSAEMARRFRTEIKLARQVRHPNVCAIHEYGEEGALQYISMELVDGVDLLHEVRARGPFPPAEAFDVLVQVAEGLRAIHAVGIIHRDLKTANIMRDGAGRVRLMDFGVAKLFTADGSMGETVTGQVIGTPEYMSPEQARGEPVDFRTDVYAFGIVAFELFTGTVPFRGESPAVTLLKQVEETPPLFGAAAARVPAAALPLLRKALAKNPAHRPQDAATLVLACETARSAWRETTGDEASAPVPRPMVDALAPTRMTLDRVTRSAPLPRRPSRALVLGSAALMIAAALALGIVAMRDGRAVDPPAAPTRVTRRPPVTVAPGPEPSGVATPRTLTFPFWLPRTAALDGKMVVGPFPLRDGTVDATLQFPAGYWLFACVGDRSLCRPFGGPGPIQRETFEVPADLRAGAAQATIYFNPREAQLPGDPHGTLTLTFTPR